VQLSIQKKLTGGFALVLVLMGVLGAASFVVAGRASEGLATLYERNVVGLVDLVAAQESLAESSVETEGLFRATSRADRERRTEEIAELDVEDPEVARQAPRRRSQSPDQARLGPDRQGLRGLPRGP
jgi:hypothetical protein